MMLSKVIWSDPLLCLALVGVSAAQELFWLPGQANSTWLNWQFPRAAVIRDTLFVDGGSLYWEANFANATNNTGVVYSNPLGVDFQLNFSTPFNVFQNISQIFTNSSKSGGATATGNYINYEDGVMFANDFEWYTYGGLTADTIGTTPPPANAAVQYQLYSSDPTRQFLGPQFQPEELPSGITRYVTYGSSVSVPSENLGFYFAGLRAPDRGPIYTFSSANQTASTESLTLISVDMSSETLPVWSNETVPSFVPGRASGEIPWVPVSSQGALIAIGGVIYPAYAEFDSFDNSTEINQSTLISPTFMTNVSVYDISRKLWYTQPTSGDVPGARALGCTVVASAQDYSSHNIYWYGGYDGLHATVTFSDDVYVLSIPSFIWIKVYNGTFNGGRISHKCAKPYPDQMFIVGGFQDQGSSLSSPSGGIIKNFDLNKLVFLESYDPKVWSNYTVPALITDKIGGSGTGDAIKMSPANGWAHTNMTELFGTLYDATKIRNYYPYGIAVTTHSTTSTPLSSGTPSYLAPVLGAVLGFFGLSLLLLGFFLWWRRKAHTRSRTAMNSELGTEDSRRWAITNWLRGTPTDTKAPTITTESATDFAAGSPYPGGTFEMTDSQVHEMMDTSPLPELGGDRSNAFGFTPISYTERHKSVNAQQTRLSELSSPPGAFRASDASSNIRPAVSPIVRSKSTSSPTHHERGGSDFSGVSDEGADSEIWKGHRRGVSEATVSVDGKESARPQEGPGSGTGVMSPLTPPEGVRGGGDYIDMGGAFSNVEELPGKIDAQETPATPAKIRKSNFSEAFEEAGL